MHCDVRYERTTPGPGIDWNYVTTAACVYVLDLPHSQIPCEFNNQWLSIKYTHHDGRETITFVVARAYAFDGCSVVPDFDGTVDGSLPHDVLYQFVDELAKAWGVSVAQVLAFADLRFKDVMIYNKVPPAVYKTYYAGVSVFGWLFNRGRKFWRSLTGT